MSLTNLDELKATLKRVAPLDLASIAPLPLPITISSFLDVDGSPKGFHHPDSLTDLVIKKFYSIPIYPYPIGLHDCSPVFVCNPRYQPNRLCQMCYSVNKTPYGFMCESDSSHFVHQIRYMIKCLQKRRHQHHLLTTLREYMQVLSEYNKRKLAYKEGLRQSDVSYLKYADHLKSGKQVE